MIVDKKLENGVFVPDVPSWLIGQSFLAEYLKATDNFKLHLSPELEVLNPNEITALQGEQYLDSITINGQNGLEVVMGIVNSQSLIVQRFFAKAEVWRKDTKALQDICTALGLDINTVFSEAKKFDRFLK